MGKSGNPEKRAAQEAEALKISQVGDFKKRLGGVMELPSGVVVKVRNPGGMKVFMANGMIPNSLMGMITKGLESGTGADAEEMLTKDGKLDPEMMSDMMELMDNILVKVVVEPPVHPNLTDEDVEAYNKAHPELDPITNIEQLRDPETLYADEFPDDDKMFLFQWVTGGTRDLETFRQRQTSRMGDLAEVAVARGNAS